MKNTQKQPQLKITKYHKSIIKYLIRHKYLNRIQIQKLLKHKNHHRILIWLNELAKKRYLARDYKNGINRRPAVYCLDIKSKDILEKDFGFSKDKIRRIYQDRKNSTKYKTHLVFLADIYLSLEKFVKKIHGKLSYFNKIDLNKTAHLIYPYPDAYFAIEDKHKNIKRYFLDIFDPALNLKWPDKRVIQYFEYFDKEIWQDNTNKPFPEVILVMQNEKDMEELKRFILKQLRRRISDIKFYVTTWKDIKQNGMNSKVLYRVNASS